MENANSVDEAKLKASLDMKKLPRHIAVIMDGNGRWAMKQKLARSAGHRAAMKAVRSVVKVCGELEIPVLTLYTFSAENWTRPRWEVNAIMKLLIEQLQGALHDVQVPVGDRIEAGGVDGDSTLTHAGSSSSGLGSKRSNRVSP